MASLVNSRFTLVTTNYDPKPHYDRISTLSQEIGEYAVYRLAYTPKSVEAFTKDFNYDMQAAEKAKEIAATQPK